MSRGRTLLRTFRRSEHEAWRLDWIAHQMHVVENQKQDWLETELADLGMNRR